MSEPCEWLIRKGGYYYRPNRSGYTTRKIEAGRYTKAEADREASVEPWHMSAIHQDEVPDEPAVVDLSETIASLQAEVERLTREKEEIAQRCRIAVADRIGHAVVINELRAELAKLREGGEPVAGWNDVSSAPKDGTMLRLLVRPGMSEDDGWTPFADSTDPYVTVGFNALSDTMEDEWQFAGWDWSHDCFTDGAGEVIGWLPLHPTTEQTDARSDVREAMKLAETALRPFYNAVLNDNGDITVDGPYSYDEAVAGYFAYRKVEAALSALSPDAPEGRQEADRKAVDRDEASPAEYARPLSRPTERAVTEAWQPIETAPKDGTVVDLWHAEWGRHPDCKWGFPEHTCAEAGNYCDSDWHRLEEGWVDTTMNEVFEAEGEFTHWKPRPAAPALAQKGK